MEVVGRGGRPRKAPIVLGPVRRLEKRIRGGEVGDSLPPPL
jgi:phosphoenolpyruvate carboxylase